jgi:FAD/FMN-containing dehydrogenase
MASPQSEDEVCRLVRAAGRAGQTVRVVGSGHSFVPLCASDEVLLLLTGLQGVISTGFSR